MKNNSIFIVIAATICAVTFVSSCNKEGEIKGLNGKCVNLVVNAKNTVETKAGSSFQSAETFELSENGFSIYVTSSKSVNNNDPFDSAVATKGAEKEAKDISEGFTMYMYADADGSLYKSGVVKNLSSDGKYWSFFDGDDQILWPEEAESGSKYSFMSYVAADNMITSDNSTHSLSYKGMDHGTDADADNSEDLLVAYTQGFQHDHDAQNLVDLNFYHPLAAVKFYVSSRVKKIGITNVRKGGSFTYSDTDDFTKAFTWDVSSDDDNLVSYVQKVNEGDVNESTGYATYEFFLVPISFDEQDVKLTFDVEGDDGRVHQISTLANNFGTNSWDAGYRYNYYIDETSVRKIGLAVSEGFQDYVKTNVSVQNIARSTAYVRATVVANWETAKGKILQSFKGTIDYNVGEGSNWVKGDDGYYYYKKPLVGYTTTDPLIDKFEDTTSSSDLNFQLNNYRLVWHIVVQGVEYNYLKTYVGEAWEGVTVGGESLVDVLEVE